MTTSTIYADRLWRNTRLVVIDTETTGLAADARIIAIAIYCVENGATVRSWSTLINPAPTPIGATHIHNLDATKLAAAPPFAKVVPAISNFLWDETKTVYVAGHNVGYDLGRLHYEFQRLDLTFGPVSMLDTKRIAPALGFGSSGSTLAEFAAACGLANPSAHEANADALITREVLLTCIDRFVSDGHHDLTQFVTPFIPKHRYVSDDELLELSEEHLRAHNEPMTTRADRNRLLDQCLAWECPILHRRMLDGAVDSRSAGELADWAAARLADNPPRHIAALLATGSARALRLRRDLSSKFSRHKHVEEALALLDSYPAWHACDDPAERCDRCAGASTRRCRFEAVPIDLMNTLLYDTDGRADRYQAHQFLYGTATRPLTSKTWFHEFSQRAPHASRHVAVTAARILRSAGDGADAQRVTGILWRAGHRDARLCELHAALAEDNISGRTERTRTKDALEICEEGLAAGTPGNWERVEAKARRLQRKLDAADRPEHATRRNTRAAHPTRFAKP